MIRNEFKIVSLIVKEFIGKLTKQECEELNVWKKDNKPFYDNLTNPDSIRQHFETSNEFNTDLAWNNISERIRKHESKRKFIKFSKYAAILILPVILIGGLYFYSEKQSETIESITYSVIETPRGGECTVKLCDGTTVQLNSMSKITYPESFVGDARTVTLEGEAFFDVTSDTSKPFIVQTTNMDIEVLGTSFDISAYNDEPTSAVLVNGSVKLTADSGESIVLSPGQKATVTPSESSISIENVDTEFYTSWTKGKIYFKDERLEDIIKVLQRWYKFDVEYRNESIKDLRFGCYVNRCEDISIFIDLLETTGKIKTQKTHNNYIIYN